MSDAGRLLVMLGRVALIVAIVLGTLLAMGRAAGVIWPIGHDAHAYWAMELADPYRISVPGEKDAFNYSPAFAQLVAPFGALPFPIFLGLWTGLLVAALTRLAGPLTLVVVLFQPVWLELVVGNINLLIALAVVIGFRYPAAWAFMLLTKVTPGIGLLWFLFRREWRNLALALVATLVIVAVSFAISPSSWVQWFGVLVADSGHTHVTGAYLDAPLLLRLTIAAVLILVGAHWNQRWVLPIATMLALPYVWESTLSMLVAILVLGRHDATRVVRRAVGAATRIREGQSLEVGAPECR